MIFLVHNTGKGPRHVTLANGRKKSVEPSDEDTAQRLDLHPAQARQLFLLAQRNAKNPSSIIVRATDDEGRNILTGRVPVSSPEKPADSSGPETASPYDEKASSAPVSSSAPAAGPRETLLEEASTLELDVLRERAAEILGNDAPKDIARMKRRDIIKTLGE